jgi:2-C-methyl-D-erythritol 4-phosphate cytidylyltransferase / 2-C-methyl-D-erythritol 2,4-cyclodiphosphate synthase
MLADVARPVTVVVGGVTRQESVAAALEAAPAACDYILCHDAARPFASPRLFEDVIAMLRAHEEADGVIPVLEVTDTVKRVRGSVVVATEDRADLRIAQTPQGFRGRALRSAHRRAAAAGEHFTDDAALVEWAGGRVVTVAGEADNFKVTTAADLERARSMVEAGVPPAEGAGDG